MLWTSLRFGWGNSGPVILLALLPLLAAPGLAARAPARPEAFAQLRSAEPVTPVTVVTDEQVATDTRTSQQGRD